MEQIKSDLIFDLHPSDGRLLVNEAEKQKDLVHPCSSGNYHEWQACKGHETWDVRKQLLDFHSSIIIDSR